MIEKWHQELYRRVLSIISNLERQMLVGPCCRCTWERVNKDWAPGELKKRVEKALLRQDKGKRKGPVLTRHR